MEKQRSGRPWIPAELTQAPFLMGMGLVIAYDALTPFLNPGPVSSLINVADCAEIVRTLLFLVAAALAPRASIALNRPWLPLFIGTAASGGVVLVVLACFVSHPVVATFAAFTGSVGIGLFWCFALLKFCELFTKVSLGCTIATFVLCHLAGSAIATVIAYLDARATALVLLFAIPIALLSWGRRCSQFALSPTHDIAPDDAMRPSIPLRPFALMLVTLFVAAMVRNRVPISLEPATYLGPLLCAIALTMTMQVKRHAVHPRVLYHLTLFLLMIGLLLYTQSSKPLLVAAGGSVNAGYLCFDVLILALLCNVCRRYVVNPYWMFGLLGFVERVAYDTGSQAGAFLSMQSDEFRFLVAFGCAIVVTAAFVTLLTERDYRTSWGTMKDEDKINLVASYYQGLPDACATISEQFGLTRREEDVLLLLAQRKTVPDIERELFISNSTAKTHCKNIYKKLGIHKREELLVLMGHPSVATSDHIQPAE